MLLRINLFTCCLGLLLLLFLGCGKDPDLVSTTPTPAPAPVATVEGTYKVTSGTVTPGLVGVTDLASLAAVYTGGNCLTEATLTFNANGTITNSNPTSCQSVNAQALITGLGIGNGGKWSYVSATNTLTITYGTNQTRTLTTTLTDKTMNLRGTLANNPLDGTPGTFTYVLLLTRS
jgi:hypothetical protein